MNARQRRWSLDKAIPSNVHWTWPRLLLSVLWVGVLAIAIVGMRHYQVGNDLSQWSGEAIADAHNSSAVVLGWEPLLDQAEQLRLMQDIEAIESVSSIVPSEILLAGATMAHPIKEPALQGILIEHDPEASRSALMDDLRGACKRHRLADDQIFLSGSTAISAALDDWSQRGLKFASILILVTGFVGVWRSTRSIPVSLLTCLAVYASQLMLMGAWGWSGRAVDMMLTAVPPLTMALGFSFALHRVARRNIFLPMLLCGGTTAAGFLTLVITSTPAIQGFGLWGAIGIALVWTSVMLMVPDGKLCNTINQSRLYEKPQRSYLTASLPAVMILAVVISLLAIPSFWSIRVSDNPLLELPAISTIRNDTEQIDNRLMGTLPSRLVLPEGLSLPAQKLAQLPEVQQVIPQANTDTGQEVWLLLSLNREPDRLASAVEPYLRGGAAWTGPAAQVNALARSVKTTAALSIPIMFILTTAVLWGICRNLFVAAVGSWVCLLPVLALVAIVGVLDLPIGLTALMTGAIALGVAVDDTIHLLMATNAHGIIRAWQSCKRPCLHSSLIAAGCALCLVTAPFRPTATFGLLLAASILVAVLADLYVLPAALSRLMLKNSYKRSTPQSPFGAQPA